MDKTYGSCGHIVSMNDLEKSPSIMMDFDSNGERTLGSSVLCGDCRKLYSRMGVVLVGDDMEQAGLDGKIEHPNGSQNE